MRELVSSPISYLKAPAFRFIWVLYGGTYGAANLFSDKPPAPMPKPAMASWWVRDFISMGVIFSGPPMLANHLQEEMGYKKSVAEPVAQFTLPLLLQPFVAP